MVALQVFVFAIVALKLHQWTSNHIQGCAEGRSLEPRRALLTLLVATSASVFSILAPRFVSLMIAVVALEPLLRSLRSWFVERKKWCSELPHFYDCALLEIRSGKGVREIFSAAIPDSRWSLRHRQMLSRILLSTPNETARDPQSRRRETELKSILSGGSRCADRLQTFREQSRIEDRLQRLKMRALRLARVQAMMVTLLFGGLSALQAHNDPNFFFSIWFKWGAFLLALGLAMMMILGRSFRWRT